jgi:hypothetical protein
MMEAANMLSPDSMAVAPLTAAAVVTAKSI